MSKSTAATQKRTRTGCRTCRQRKLKCDEDRPICGQCRKSNRECIASEGVTFRHAQNAGFTDGDGSEKDLANFYKYRQKFDQTNYFLPIPRELTFVEVTDPYAEDFTLPSPSHGLRYTNFTTPALPTLASSDPPQYADVAASSLKAMIDPQLEQMLGLTESIMDGKLTETATDLTFTATTAAEQEAQDRFQETIVQALRESEEQVKDEAVV